MSGPAAVERDHYAVLLACLDSVEPGGRWTVDSWRWQADAAQLTSAERGAAQRQAVTEGYLRPALVMVGGAPETIFVRSKHPKGKGRRVELYTRTAHRVSREAVA